MNKNRVLYKCSDCGERHFVKTLMLNRRSGDRCMGCGGQMLPESKNAFKREQTAASNWNEPEKGSVMKLNRNGKRK